ncbi:hypothetical protein [Actinomadura sp. WMMA1423]|uniref:hypothetical protein n=1 Tax=Actinomadura sp. WMMA1423 TaxID=2591108 RepID=UPI001146A3A5|nr:hypothetical protein [Actinomadura sp. WMMA1423]
MTAEQSEFSLRALVREVAEQWPLMPPGLLAKKVAERIPEEHLRESVGQTMGLFVRQVMHEARPSAAGKSMGHLSQPAPRPAPAPVAAPPPAPVPSTSPAAAPRPSSPAGAPAPALASGQGSPAAQPSPTPTLAAAKPRVVSSRKGAEIRDGWQRHLDAEYPVQAGYKKLGDCTYEDLYFLAAERDKQAESLKAHGRYFRGLAGLLVDHDVKTLRELPVEVQMQAVGS